MRAAARGATKREREWVPTASNVGGPGLERVLPRAGGLRRRPDHAPDDPAPARELAGHGHVRDDGPLARVVERPAPVDEPAVALERAPPHGRVDQLPPRRGLGAPRGVGEMSRGLDEEPPQVLVPGLGDPAPAAPPAAGALRGEAGPRRQPGPRALEDGAREGGEPRPARAAPPPAQAGRLAAVPPGRRAAPGARGL